MEIQVKNLCFSRKDTQILKNISFTFYTNQIISVLGPNGIGKSTLFKCILGLLPIDSGEIYINEKNIENISRKQLSSLIAYIPQSHNPIFNYKVIDMVIMGTASKISEFSCPREEDILIAKDALEKVGILYLQDREYFKLSGGERQLVLIARAIAQRAKILVMDEPSSSLDFGNKTRLMLLLEKLKKEGYAIIQSTHDPKQAFSYSDKILAIYKGEVFSFDEPKNIDFEKLISKIYDINLNDCKERNYAK